MEEKLQVNETEFYVHRLEFKISMMKFLGMLLLMVTAINVFLLMILWIAGYESFLPTFANLNRMSVAYGTAPFLIALFAAFRFDQLRREGETLFEVISDELHAKSDSSFGSIDRADGQRISMRAKYVLRQFSRNSDLPLFPGKFGPAVLCLLNMFFAFAYAILFSLKR